MLKFIFFKGHKILRHLHSRFEWHYIGQIYGGDVAKICGRLRIYELNVLVPSFFEVLLTYEVRKDGKKQIAKSKVKADHTTYLNSQISTVTLLKRLLFFQHSI